MTLFPVIASIMTLSTAKIVTVTYARNHMMLELSHVRNISSLQNATRRNLIVERLCAMNVYRWSSAPNAANGGQRSAITMSTSAENLDIYVEDVLSFINLRHAISSVVATQSSVISYQLNFVVSRGDCFIGNDIDLLTIVASL
jgi:hypothetical protein